MAVAKATGDAEKVIDQIMMERLLDAVCPKLRAWLKEQEPKTVEELGNLASLYVQSRKGQLVGGKYVTYWGGGKSGKKERFGGKADDSLPEEKQNQNQEKPWKPWPFPEQKTSKPEIKCYKCGKPGYLSFNCGKGRGKP